MLARFDQTNSSAEFSRPPPTIATDGAIEGYASLFGEVDQSRDMVMPGAFTASLRQRGVRRVPMLFQHDPSEPIGVWLELREDSLGLYARGRLIPEVVRARELLALLKAGAADGLSIGFRTVKGRVDPRTRIRKLEAIDLWEISIVTFPLLAGARVRTVKGSQMPSQPKLLPHSGAPLQAGQGRVAPGRARHTGPVDASNRTFQPERLFRRQPQFRFGPGKASLSWRDLILPEKSLRSSASRRRGG
jgi:HK97 family phage prohead protease